MAVQGFDHVAIPIEHVEAMLAFYERLGFTIDRHEADGYYAVHFGRDQRINFHDPGKWRGGAFTLRGPAALPGCGDFCFVWDGTLAALGDFLAAAGAEIDHGPSTRTGGRAQGKATGQSLYIRDPDRNLLEFIVYP